jgi:outer membrane protein assembly factor BamB
VALILAGCGSGGGSSSADGGSSVGSTVGTTTPASGESVTGAGSSKSDAPLIDWPYFGRVPERTHYLPLESRPLDPPLKQAWSISTHALIEFPPAIANGVAYVVNKYGNGKAVRLKDRKVIGETNFGPNKGNPTDVTAPVYYQGDLYGAFLDGTLAAANPQTGKLDWERKLHAHLESSPLGVEGRLYLGTDKAQVLALDAKTGKTDWAFAAPGAVKASPSYDNGQLFVADYESTMFALNAATGKPTWRSNTSKVAPYGEGGFFSSPAVAFGRVYAARNDGIVYAFDEKTGKVDWSFPTGGAVYGSPAVARVPGTRPTVYIGSENGTFYALDAVTGKVRWSHSIGGPIPGTATVIGHTVYTSSFKTQNTVGFDVKTHKKTFQIHQAGYTPMVSDGRRLYLISYYSLIGLVPTKP